MSSSLQRQPANELPTTVSDTFLTPELRKLLPLPLVPFEKMMLLDDRAAHPMTCGAEFTFAGHLDRARLDDAVYQTCLRHPFFCARVQRQGANRWSWVPAAKLPSVRWIDETDDFEFDRAAHMDVRREVGLRIWAHSTATGTKLDFDFHHACADGAGGLVFLEDLLRLYAASFPSCPAKLRKLPPANFSSLHRRGRFPNSARSLKQLLAGELTNLRGVLRFIGQRPQPIVFASQPRLSVLSSSPTRQICSHVFESGFLARLRAAAAQTGATVNDLMMRALLLTIREWNQQHRVEHPNDHLRVLMPMNLRTRQDLEMPATNRMSYAILTRKIQEMADPQALLHSIARETSILRRNSMPQRALSLLNMLDKVPRGISSLFSAERCLATAVLSNVGDPTRRFRCRFPRQGGLLAVGNVLLTEFTGITPMRPLTRATLFANSYANRLTFGARLDPTLATIAETTELLQQFAARLTQVAGTTQLARAA